MNQIDEDKSDIKIQVAEFFNQTVVSGAVNTDALSSLLLRKYAELDENINLNTSKLIEKLNTDGPRQVCQYQFKKNDIVW